MVCVCYDTNVSLHRRVLRYEWVKGKRVFVALQKLRVIIECMVYFCLNTLGRYE